MIIRFVTNTTKESKETLLKRLHNCGFDNITANDMFTSLSAAEHYVRTHELRPMYMLTEDAQRDFCGVNDVSVGQENAVVVGLAPDEFNYERLNDAFR